jgi:predicted amidophosphoribosyltransferase
LCVMCCQVEVSATSWSPTVSRRCVWSRNLVIEEAIARAELQSQRKKKVIFSCIKWNYWSLRRADLIPWESTNKLKALVTHVVAAIIGLKIPNQEQPIMTVMHYMSI